MGHNHFSPIPVFKAKQSTSFSGSAAVAARWEEWEPADYGYGFFECSGGFFEFSGGFEDYR